VALASDDLRKWLRRTAASWTDDDTDQADLLLDLARGVVEDETGQPLESSTDTVILDGPADDDHPYRTGTGVRRLILPRWPVTAITAVTILDDDQALAEGPDYTWSQAGMLTRRGGWWPSGDQVVEVTYTAGFLELPAGVRRIILRLAGAAWSNPEGLSQETLGDHSRTWSAEALGMELSNADRRTLSAYAARTTS
jgi:hypothetical protein